MKTKELNHAVALCAVAAVVGISIPAAAHAGQCALVPSGVAEMGDSERADLLDEMKFEELDKALAKLHKKNLASEGTDLLTLRALVNLQQLSGNEEKLVRMWADEQPQSFFAQLNAGIFYSNQAFNARGNASASNVNSNQWRNAKKIADQAAAYTQKAMALDARSALPQSTMVSLAALGGEAGGRKAEQWLESAVQADPKNMAARISAVTYLSPRWGGSFEQLDQMTAQAAKTLPAQTSHYLQYNVVLAKASHFEVIEKNPAKAQALYKQAKGMCDNSEAARAGLVRTYQ